MMKTSSNRFVLSGLGALQSEELPAHYHVMRPPDVKAAAWREGAPTVAEWVKEQENDDRYRVEIHIERNRKIMYFREGGLYIRIPKCASSTITKVLDLRPPFEHPRDINFSRVNHIFAVTRNPFDRLVSCYTDKIVRHGWMSRCPVTLIRSRTFGEFARAVALIPDRYSNPHFRSQCDFLTDIPSTIPIHYIDMYTLNDKWEIIEKVMGPVRTSSKLDSTWMVNQSTQKPKDNLSYTKWYKNDPQLIEIVKERYKKDLELLNYDFLSERF